MSTSRAALPCLYPLAILILLCLPAGAQEVGSFETDEVIVEINPLQLDPKTGNYHLPPYNERRLSWGINFGVFYRELQPLDYLSAHDEQSYSHIYGQDKVIGMVEGQVSLQKNMNLGSIALELAAGAGQIDADKRRLSLSSLKIGGAWYVNNLFSAPYVVPFGRLGVHRLSYEDHLEGQDPISDSLSPTLFFSGGVLIQLDWLDPGSATRAYLDYGMENAYLSFEVTQYQKPPEEDAPNFASGPDLGFGIVIEF